MDEYIVNQLCLNLKNELEELVVNTEDIHASNLLAEVDKYLKHKNISNE